MSFIGRIMVLANMCTAKCKDYVLFVFTYLPLSSSSKTFYINVFMNSVIAIYRHWEGACIFTNSLFLPLFCQLSLCCFLVGFWLVWSFLLHLSDVWQYLPWCIGMEMVQWCVFPPFCLWKCLLLIVYWCCLMALFMVCIFLMLFVQDYTEGTSDKDRKLSVLVEMGFPADEAFSAINRCGILFF